MEGSAGGSPSSLQKFIERIEVMNANSTSSIGEPFNDSKPNQSWQITEPDEFQPSFTIYLIYNGFIISVDSCVQPKCECIERFRVINENRFDCGCVDTGGYTKHIGDLTISNFFAAYLYFLDRIGSYMDDMYITFNQFTEPDGEYYKKLIELGFVDDVSNDGVVDPILLNEIGKRAFEAADDNSLFSSD